ncbi:hypothetical protein [Phascolarctobacterium succinatutens]|uniref:hypothetical protein n=1 Tax=Phascolarctobacterium succinatutens TaxID=626940 RepID=UPI003F8222FD
MNENQQEKLVLVDGEIMPEAEAFIDVNDRGHNFGDGVFEIVPVYNGRCFAAAYEQFIRFRNRRKNPRRLYD